MEKLETARSERDVIGRFGLVVRIIAIGLSLYMLYILLISPIDPWIMRIIFLTVVLVIGFLSVRFTKGSSRHRVPVIDIICALASIGVAVYMLLEMDRLLFYLSWAPTTADVVVATILILLVLELLRRVTGPALTTVAVVFLIYAWAGQFMPGFLWQRGYTWARTAAYLMSFEGIYGIPLGVASTYVFLFILFGAIFQVSGASDFLIQFAYSIAGRTRGGPAKVAVVASSLMGTISGSAVANVVTTGSLTIPLMKKVGYRPQFAGAVEAVASTGGQIMPPIMGAGAFIMAQIVGVPYRSIILAAAIPAILYYISVFWMVDVEAVKLNLSGLPASQLPKLKQVLRRGWIYFVPVLAIVWVLVIQGRSPIRAAAIAMAAAVVVSWLNPKARMGPKQILLGLEKGATGIIMVGAACACAGIIVGVLALTGMGLKFGAMLAALAGGNMHIALFIAMIACVILGMSMPVTASYCVAAVVVAPGLIFLGIPTLIAHLFVFFFCAFAPITPPVCIGSYAAAGIAKANPNQVALTALKLGCVAFIVPYAFVYRPGLLLRGDLGTIVVNVAVGGVIIFALVSAMQGFISRQKLTWVARALFFASALSLVAPGAHSNILGFVILTMGLLLHFREWMKRRIRLRHG